MTRVDFYILDKQSSPENFACSIVNKVFHKGMEIHIHTESRESAVRLDDYMWTFRDISFLPHVLADDSPGEATPVTIGWEGSTRPNQDVLLNLGNNIPEFAGTFARIIEIVPPENPARDQARDRYRQYRELGYELHNHEISAKDASN